MQMHKQVRQSAVEALREIGSDAENAIPALTATMNTGNAEYRRSTVDALVAIGGNSPTVRDTLLAALKDEAAQVRHHAAFSFALSWPDVDDSIFENTVPMLTRDLERADREVRLSAAYTLGWVSLCVGPKSVPAVQAALDHEDTGVGVSVLGVFQEYFMNWLRLNPLSPLEGPPIPALMKALEDEDAEIRRIAQWVLSRTGTQVAAGGGTKEGSETHQADDCGGSRDVAKTVRGILEVLHGPRYPASERIAAALDLHQIDSDRAAAEAVPLLVDYLCDRFEYSADRAKAAETLGDIGSNTAVVVSALQKAIREADKDVTPEKQALGLDWYVWLWSAYALVKLESPDRGERLTELVGLLQDRESGFSALAAYALGQLGGDAKAAVPALTEALKDDWPALQSSAAWALKQIDPEAAAKAGLE